VYSPEFGDRVAFVNCSEATRTFTGDRTEFLGPQRHSLASPLGHAARAALGPRRRGIRSVRRLSSAADARRRAGADHHLHHRRAAGRRRPNQLAQRFRSVDSAHRAIEGVWHYWSRTLGVVYLETPDASVNFLANGWLVYQTLACRMWARSGFYQSGGAFGFRDQLQDAMALVHAQPQLLREHLLRAAPASFAKGTCSTGGIRRWDAACGRISPTITSGSAGHLPLCRGTTGDTGVLDERVPVSDIAPARRRGIQLRPAAGLRRIGTLYEHGVRAIDHGLRLASTACR
jgi:cyclic beta-1,2-glucan synthetase